MKKQLTHVKGSIPKPLNDFQTERLNECISLPGWQFDKLIKPHCVLIEEPIIDGFYSDPQEGKDATYISVCIYALLGRDKKTGEQVICNYFLRDDDRVYQFNDISGASIMVEILIKNYKRIRYVEEKEAKKQIKAA